MSQLNADTQGTGSRDRTFGYDSQDQLISVQENSTNTQICGYGYDEVGNRTDQGLVNSLNQLVAFQYNSRGDLTNDGLFTYSWDIKDRLTAVTPNSPYAGSEKDAFVCDGQDRRMEKDVYIWDATLTGGTGGWSLSSTLRYVHNGSQIISELDPGLECVESVRPLCT